MKLNKLKQHGSGEILLLLLATDLLVILAHLVCRFSSIAKNPYWLIAQDQGFGETFQYFKELWLFYSFISLSKIRFEKSYLSFALLFLYLFVDDSLSVHERLGKLIAGALNFPPLIGLQPKDLGELLVSTIVGIFFVLIISCSYWLGSQRFRHVCKRIAILIGCLAFFGVVVDMLHIMTKQIKIPFLPLNVIFELVEDGGEMLVITVLCWYGVSLLRQQDITTQKPLLKSLYSEASTLDT